MIKLKAAYIRPTLFCPVAPKKWLEEVARSFRKLLEGRELALGVASLPQLSGFMEYELLHLFVSLVGRKQTSEYRIYYVSNAVFDMVEVVTSSNI